MKITANRIKEIIREEYRRMNEADGPRVVRLDITPKELEGELRSGSGDVPRGEFGERLAEFLGLKLGDISEVYLIDSSEFQGLVVTKSGEQIRLRLGDQPKIRRDDEGALQRARELKKVARQLQAMEREPDVYESIEEERTGVATGTMSDLQRMVAANPRATTAADLAGRGSEDPGLQKLKADAIEAIRGITSAQGREDEIIQLFTNIMNIISGKKVDTPSAMTHLGRAKDAIKDTAK